MKRITNLFTFNKVGSNGTVKTMVCINNDTFISATWLAKQAELPISLLSLLIGSSINATFYAKDEVMGQDAAEADVICTDDNKVVKSFSLEFGTSLMVAKLMAA